MREGLIITTIGKDRPGIVEEVTGLIFREGGNLEDSRMAVLGGDFALMVLVTGTLAVLQRIQEKLPGLCEPLQLVHQVRRSSHPQPFDKEKSAAGVLYRIRVVAMDHPGIVHQITHLLAAFQVNVRDLETHLDQAPTTGSPVFSLLLRADVPAQTPLARLRRDLEELAGRENLDLEFHQELEL